MNRKRILMQCCLLVLVLLVILTGCNKNDENESIRLHYAINNDTSDPVKDNLISLLFPASDKIQLVIFGGDGRYTVSNSDETVIDVTMENRLINITPLSTGNSIVTITDDSENSYVLNVEVFYKEKNCTIDKQDVIVIGDKLSEVQKTEIRQKAILTLPVKVNGGFKFVYNNIEDSNKGQVLIYNDQFGGEAIESVFEFKYIKIDVDGFIQTHPVFVITIDGKQRDFIMAKYVAPKSKGDLIVPMALNEDLTMRFKTDYPDLEMVYTQQGIK